MAEKKIKRCFTLPRVRFHDAFVQGSITLGGAICAEYASPSVIARLSNVHEGKCAVHLHDGALAGGVGS